MNPTQHKLLEEWRTEFKFLLRVHYDTAAACDRSHLWIGLPAASLSAVVGSSVFATLGQQPTRIAQISVGCLSILVTILATLQTFMKFAERAQSHRIIAAAFAGLNRRVEQLLAFPPADEDLGTQICAIREEWDLVRKDSLPIPQKMLKKFQSYDSLEDTKIAKS